MPTSEARIVANRANALRSTGPKSAEGKARSRGNAVKHGLTGEGVVLPAGEAAEVERLRRGFEADFRPVGEVGRILVRRLALLAVRMERCASQETAALAEHVRRAEAEFDAEWPEPEGEEDPDRERMRERAARRALFDPSKEATLARKYEGAAERGFFRALKELREVGRVAGAAPAGSDADAARSALASSWNSAAKTSGLVRRSEDRDLPKPPAVPEGSDPAPNPRPMPVLTSPVSPVTPPSGVFHVPFAIGRAR